MSNGAWNVKRENSKYGMLFFKCYYILTYLYFFLSKQAMIRGEMLNRLFGGQCGFTALALMNMLPMPLNEINGNLDHKKLDFEDEEFLDFVLEKKDELSWASDEFDDDSSEEEDSSEENDD